MLKVTTETKQPDAMLRKYAVDYSGMIHFVSEFASPGWYVCQRLDHLGTPLHSKLTAIRELAKMTLHTNLREARAAGGAAAAKYAALHARYGK
jgi:hypothetical protein